MNPAREAIKIPKSTSLLATIVITSIVSFIGAIAVLQGADIVFWMRVLIVLYGVELVYAGIAGVIYYRSPAARQRREFYRRRRSPL